MTYKSIPAGYRGGRGIRPAVKPGHGWARFLSLILRSFQAQTAAGARDPATDDAGTLEGVPGTTHAALSAQRGVSVENQAAYAAGLVLNKACSAGGMGNARQFPAPLSALKLDAVRQNHCLAALEANRGFLADTQYERDKRLFTRLQTRLAAGM